MDRFVGKRLDGRYEIQEIIGVGGMAVVYKAHDNQENRTVAIKILKEEFLSNEEFLRRFKNESKAIAMLSHPNIVKVYDVSFGDLIQYIVMEHIEGITLKEYIETEGSLRWKDAVHFAIQILKGLQHAHDKGIVHRDVKPQNIMVLPDGTIKVTDFGIARFARSEQRTITDKAIGSVHYISPEQARGEKTDEKADIYSVGVMLYEMLTGQLPFQAESAVSVAIMQLQRDPQLPTEINGSIPLGLEQITMHAMQKTPERRYQSSAEMLCDLAQFRKDPSLTFEYTYFVDNSPTKYVGTLGASGEIITEEPSANETETETKEKSAIIPILSGIAVTLILAIIVLAVFFIKDFLTETGEEIVCPDFVGHSYEEILGNEEYKINFKFEDEWETNNDFAYGIVYEQSETAGEKLKKGANITLYVSMGQSTKKVPDVYGETESAAVSQLKSNGFSVVITEEVSEDVEQGKVIRTEPQRTQVVEEGAKITVFVSSGKPTKNVKIPDVIGLTQEDADEKLRDEGLTVKVMEAQISFDDKYYPVGYVVKQSPESSSKDVPEGTEVEIYVCSGYIFDVEVSLPFDFETETYYLSLWQDGKMISEGNKVNSAELSTYTFEELVSKENNIDLTVKISADKNDYYNLFDITVNCEKSRVAITKEYTSYPKPKPIEPEPDEETVSNPENIPDPQDDSSSDETTSDAGEENSDENITDDTDEVSQDGTSEEE